MLDRRADCVVRGAGFPHCRRPRPPAPRPVLPPLADLLVAMIPLLPALFRMNNLFL